MAVDSAEFRKCPSCKRDKWLNQFAVNGYCTECARTKGRMSATKRRNADREAFNKYHREYSPGWRKARPKTTRHVLLSDL